MPSRVLRRRAATAFGVYGAALVGFLATVVAARELSVPDFARFAIVFATTSMLQLFVDLTIDEVVVKYGNRYAAREDWGRFRRLFEIGLVVKMAGGAAGSLAIAGAALLAPHIWTSVHGLRDAMLIAALIPLIQQPEGMAGAVLLVRNRYDLRGALLFWSMLLRLVGIAIGARHGVIWVFTAIVAAQVVSSVTVCAVGYAAYRRYPRVARAPLAGDAREIRNFAIQSTIASGLTSLRTSLPTMLVGLVATGRHVGYFRVAQAPSTAFASLSAPARMVLLAEQTRDVEHGRADRAYALLRRYIAGTAAIGVAITPVLWIAMPTLIRWVYKAKYVPAANAFRVMLLAAVVQLVFGWTKSFPVSIGRAGLRTAGQVCEIAVLVPAVLLLADRYGATGAAGGVLAGALTLGAFWSVALLRMPRPA